LKGIVVLAAVVLLACSRRQAEIENVPDAGAVVVPEPSRPDGGVPVVAAAPLENAQGLACRDRPSQAACQGVNDFPCDFDGWFQDLAAGCQRNTDCTDGWVEAQVGAEGCADELRMEDPDPAFVACISEQLSKYRCPCADVVGSRFMGLGHGECDTSCGTGELRCPPGSRCQDGQCVVDTDDMVGGSGG